MEDLKKKKIINIGGEIMLLVLETPKWSIIHNKWYIRYNGRVQHLQWFTYKYKFLAKPVHM